MTRARDLGDFIADGAAAELVVDTTTLVVDSTNNRVGIGTASPATALDLVGNATITVADNSDALTIVSTDADANAGPILKLRRNSASPADNDLIGAIDWTSENSSGDEHDFLNLTARMRDVTAGSEDVAYAWTAYLNGTGREIQSFVNTDASAASMVFNEDSQDIDFRVESNGNANMLFVDGGNDAVGIGTNSPARSLQVDSTNNRVASFRHTDGSSAYVTFSDSSTTDDGSVRIGAIGNDLVNFVGGAERFRFGTSGQLGIGGATYGTSGQVLTSGGASAAPTWGDAGGGGSIELTASENITAGDCIVLKSNGQSSKVGYSANSTTVGTEIKTATSTSINYPAAAYDPDTAKVGVVYSDSAARAQAAIFSPSGYGGSFGTATQILSDQDARENNVMYDTTNNQFVGVHLLTSDNSGKYFVLSTNGSTMTVDTSNSNFEGSEVTHLNMDIDQTAAKVFVVYRHNNNSSRGTVIAGTLNDGSVSWGSSHVFYNGADAESPSVSWNSEADVLGIFYKSGSGNVLRYQALTVSGTSFTNRNDLTQNYNVSGVMSVADTTNSSASSAVFHVAYWGSGGIQIHRVSFATSGWSASYSDVHVISTATPSNFGYPYAGNSSFIRDPLTGLMFLYTKNDSALFIIEYNASTDSYTAEKRIDANSWMVSDEAITRFGTTQNTTTGTIYHAIRDSSNNLGMQTNSVSDVSAFLGLSESTVTSGNTHKVTVISGVNEAVSGLTPGSTYYLTGAGALTTTNTGTKIGKALAANKLYIDSTGD